MKTNEEINKWFTEEVFGKCWHEFIYKPDVMSGHGESFKRCKFCNTPKSYVKSLNWNAQSEYNNNPDYFSKDGFWDVWEWIQNNWKWLDFAEYLRHKYTLGAEDNIPHDSINYKTFAREVYDFLEGKG